MPFIAEHKYQQSVFLEAIPARLVGVCLLIIGHQVSRGQRGGLSDAASAKRSRIATPERGP